jgi:VWFA-related protein
VWALAVALSTALLGAAAHAARQQATFSAGNRTVAIYATVAGADGRLLPDLLGSDFDVDDNGKLQDLTLFANDIQPITLVMLLDRSTSMRANFQLVEQAAEAFVAAMLPADKARIGSFSNRIQLDPVDFTSSHDELLQNLKTELQEEGPTPLWNAVNVGITALLHQEGRRVILVFTDGVDSPGNGGNNNSSLKDVMRRAEEENVMVYAIGLAGNNSRARSSGYGPPGGGFGGPGGRRGGRGGFGGGGGRGGGFGQGGGGGGSSGPEKPDAGLPKIAAATGGGYFELTTTDDLAATFTRVADELHHQYALGFAPTNLDGKMHTLQVHVHLTGTTVRARQNYLAAKTQ